MPRTHGLARPHAWMPSSKKLDCVPLNSSQLIGYHLPTSIIIFCSRLLFLSFSFICFMIFVFFFFPPYYEIVELGTTTLRWKLGIIFTQRLLLPSDEPKNAGVAA